MKRPRARKNQKNNTKTRRRRTVSFKESAPKRIDEKLLAAVKVPSRDLLCNGTLRQKYDNLGLTNHCNGDLFSVKNNQLLNKITVENSFKNSTKISESSDAPMSPCENIYADTVADILLKDPHACNGSTLAPALEIVGGLSFAEELKQSVGRLRPLPRGDAAYLETLVKKFGITEELRASPSRLLAVLQKIALDISVNRLQWTVGKLRRSLAQHYHCAM